MDIVRSSKKRKVKRVCFCAYEKLYNINIYGNPLNLSRERASRLPPCLLQTWSLLRKRLLRKERRERIREIGMYW